MKISGLGQSVATALMTTLLSSAGADSQVVSIKSPHSTDPHNFTGTIAVNEMGESRIITTSHGLSGLFYANVNGEVLPGSQTDLNSSNAREKFLQTLRKFSGAKYFGRPLYCQFNYQVGNRTFQFNAVEAAIGIPQQSFEDNGYIVNNIDIDRRPVLLNGVQETLPPSEINNSTLRTRRQFGGLTEAYKSRMVTDTGFGWSGAGLIRQVNNKRYLLGVFSAVDLLRRNWVAGHFFQSPNSSIPFRLNFPIVSSLLGTRRLENPRLNQQPDFCRPL